MEMVDLDTLRQTALLSGFPVSEIREIQPLCRIHRFPAGQKVFSADEAADKIWILLDGKIALVFDTPQFKRIPYSAVDIGGTFGWSAFVAPGRYTTSAECVEPSKVLSIDANGLRELIKDKPGIIFNVMQHIMDVVSSRLMDARVQHTRALEEIERLRKEKAS